MKKLVILFMVTLLSFTIGCSKNEKPTYNYESMTKIERVQFLHNNFYIPLHNLFDEFVNEYNTTAKNTKTLKEFYEVSNSLIENKYASTIYSKLSLLPPRNSKTKEEIYDYICELEYLHEVFSIILSDVSKWDKYAADKYPSQTPQYEEIDIDKIKWFWEQELNYKNQYSLITHNKPSFNISKETYNKISFGNSEYEVMDILQMQGEHSMDLSTKDIEVYIWEYEGKKIICYFDVDEEGNYKLIKKESYNF